jgi:hypothetical protein
MKNSLIFFLITLPSFAYTQDKATLNLPRDSSGKVVYTEVINVDGIQKAELFNRAKSWFVSSFRSSNDVIQNSDKEVGIVEGKGNIPVNYTAMGIVYDSGCFRFFVSVACKDGKYKYTISNITKDETRYQVAGNMENDSAPGYGWTNRTWNQVRTQADSSIQGLIVKLKDTMMKQSASEGNW